MVSGVFFFKQKTAYEMRISDWSSDVCSSDLQHDIDRARRQRVDHRRRDRHEQDLEQRRADNDVRPHAEEKAHRGPPDNAAADTEQLGRASCRERVCQYVSISGVAVSLKKKHIPNNLSYKSQTPQTPLY